MHNIDGVVKAFYDCTLCIYFKGYEDKYDCLSIDDVYGLKEFIDKNLGDNYSVCCYKDIDVIKEDTMFLTRADCDKHIKENSHHYNNPYSYSMTAWRSPKVERLFKILLETNWNENNIEVLINMCDYCEKEKNLSEKGTPLLYMFKNKNNKYVLYMENNDTDLIEINFPPICGRDLRNKITDTYKIRIEYLWNNCGYKDKEELFETDYNNNDRFHISQVGTFYFWKDNNGNIRLKFQPDVNYMAIKYIKETYNYKEYEDKLNDIYEGIHEDDLIILDKPFLVEHDIIMGMPVKLTLSKVNKNNS